LDVNKSYLCKNLNISKNIQYIMHNEWYTSEKKLAAKLVIEPLITNLTNIVETLNTIN